MVLTLPPELEAALNERAKKKGVTPQEIALDALHERFLGSLPLLEPRDEWERRLRAAARDCGVSLSNWALSSDALYD
ncbi:MAG: hypothetical protein K2R98_18285 [Gemmataceae bacterium]|nr:hypothetical protein [Gemmataceae bacterium]